MGTRRPGGRVTGSLFERLPTTDVGLKLTVLSCSLTLTESATLPLNSSTCKICIIHNFPRSLSGPAYDSTKVLKRKRKHTFNFKMILITHLQKWGVLTFHLLLIPHLIDFCGRDRSEENTRTCHWLQVLSQEIWGKGGCCGSMLICSIWERGSMSFQNLIEMEHFISLPWVLIKNGAWQVVFLGTPTATASWG